MTARSAHDRPTACARRPRRRLATCVAAGSLAAATLGAAVGPAAAFQVRREKGRFDALVIMDPSVRASVTGAPLASLAASDPAAVAWSAWRAAHAGTWDVTLDRRSGAPLLVQGSGLPWFATDAGGTAPRPAVPSVTARAGDAPRLAGPVTVDALESSLRAFLKASEAQLLARDEELVLDRGSSGPMGPDGAWQIVFTRAVGGVPVDGDRYLFHFTRGRLIAFGATRWTPIAVSTRPSLAPDDALRVLRGYMGLTTRDAVALVAPGTLHLVARAADGTEHAAYSGHSGGGYSASLVWRFALRVAGEPGTWEGTVDAHTGAVVALEDADRYARVKGGVYPQSNDRICPSGCEQPSYPMPFATMTGSGADLVSNASGLFECPAGGASASTSLAGPYIRIHDVCGAIQEGAPCGSDLDFRTSPGTDCAIPAGASAGNTHAARTGFYHLNRIAEKARAYLPSNSWLARTLVGNVNIDDACNAYWNGATINFYKSGNGCGNTGEIAAVFQHEWAHGLDQNDGGGFDNPSEAYADTAAFLESHSSCLGRGFLQTGSCEGYGNACLGCSGVRDVDWQKRADLTPSTPAQFVASRCPQGNGPCGGEVHCEAYVADEAMWDFAARDLPASGVEPATAWPIVERLWYLSRAGSGGGAYNCALPFSDGCGASSWFTKLRAIDDDDGDLANGTPHAAALFAAFARHGIACGGASDPSNQSFTICPAMGAPVLSAAGAAQAAVLSWPAVVGAASYRILRGDGTCATTATPVATVTGTGYSDLGLADGFPVHYTVQAVGENGACLGPVSACADVVPQPFAGIVTLDRGVYGCGDAVQVRVRDGNAPAGGVTVLLASAAEPAGETIALAPIAPGSPVQAAILALTSNPATPSDAKLSVQDGDTVTAVYVDADDGAGGIGATRTAQAAIDCAPPAITNVRAEEVTGRSAVIRWTTSEPADSAVHYGLVEPAGTKVASGARVLDHEVALDGLEECRLYRYLVESTDLAGNLATDAGAGASSGYLLATPKSTHPSYTSVDTPIAIPDNDLEGTTSTIVVTDDHPIRGITVRIALEHGFDADLIVSLVAPDGRAIRLVERRGGGVADFQDTVFDDAAADPVWLGQAPFLGSYRPEEALTTFLNLRAGGVWTLRVQDVEAIDVGRILSWSLRLTYPEAECGAHAIYADHRIVEDACGSGGAGTGNGTWDSGERARLSVRIENDGSVPLTGVHAAVTALTEGVVLAQNLVEYEDVPANAVAAPRDPQVVADLTSAFACGTEAAFRLDIASDQGSWSSTFTQFIGRPLVATTTAINETFTSGIPQGWVIVNGGVGTGAASTWTASNPGHRTFPPPIGLPVAIVDSDRGGVDAHQDEQLITPSRDLRTAITASLEWDQSFVWYPGRGDEKGDVDVRSSATGGAWVTVRRNQGSTTLEPDHRRYDITTLAAGAQNVQVRFHYYDASFEWWWAIDNVRLLANRAGGCAQSTCAPAATPPPVPDGAFGAAMTARRLGSSGSQVRVTWDVSSCPAPGYHILYGDLGSVAAHQPLGAVCEVDSDGVFDWSGVPDGNLWFLVVSDNGTGLEGLWGRDSSGASIGGVTPSNTCGLLLRENGSTCEGLALP